MSPEAQRIAIAEACGWTDVRRPIDDSYHAIDTDTLSWLMSRVAGVKPGERVHKPLPDYLNDLNAMNEAYCATIAGNCGHEDIFTVELARACGLDNDSYYPNLSAYDIAVVSNAAPAQRAEAFLRTLGKWEESA